VVRGRVSGRAGKTSRILEGKISITHRDPSHDKLTEQAPAAYQYARKAKRCGPPKRQIKTNTTPAQRAEPLDRREAPR
jgi:hypothetical protein